MLTFVLVHSPLVGPLTWSRVGDELRRRGLEVRLAELRQREDTAEPYWRRNAASVAEAVLPLPADRQIILVAHSGAGPLLPVIRREAGRPVAAYMFVDAGLPHGGQARMDEGAFGDALRALYGRGERFPNWRAAELAEVVPDPDLRAHLLREVRPQPLAFWEEVHPAVEGWPDAPCAYLQFSPPYDRAAEQARRAGWLCQRLEGGHFHMLVDPPAVAEALLDLVRRVGLPGTPSNRG